MTCDLLATRRRQAAPVAITELSGWVPVLATGRPKSPSRRPGQAMITFNRIFTTERLLQIIVILAATVAMKLMS
ncbi:hypothetical protein GA0061098_1018170 [Bradyrhizobium shewense]|uniref:Uncharacterized protein n=2 Tax=Bradyrhizobium TaxID=374 RepID=A0A1C3XMH4_9BRAD|nr:hypothetical protein GA0061098_1018170 [Bradyrhizobium shewense]